MPRNYRQFCALARALDVVGERWTLLIVRELLLGPRRYGELLDALAGMGTNLLADRLEQLQAAGVVERAGREYALTRRGLGLRDAVLALARWGMAPLAASTDQDRMRPDWYAVAMLAGHRPPARPRAESYAFDVDGSQFHLRIEGARADARRGLPGNPAFTLRADLRTFLGVATETLPLAAAEIDGDGRAARRWLAAFALPAPT